MYRTQFVAVDVPCSRTSDSYNTSHRKTSGRHVRCCGKSLPTPARERSKFLSAVIAR